MTVVADDVLFIGLLTGLSTPQLLRQPQGIFGERADYWDNPIEFRS